MEKFCKAWVHIMIRVLENIKIKNITILVCSWFDGDVIANTLQTDVGCFNHTMFEVLPVKNCFSKPITRHIVIKKIFERDIKYVNFSND